MTLRQYLALCATALVALSSCGGSDHGSNEMVRNAMRAVDYCTHRPHLLEGRHTERYLMRCIDQVLSRTERPGR
jgi:hypothetical protein